jgi:hypothetical protein
MKKSRMEMTPQPGESYRPDSRDSDDTYVRKTKSKTLLTKKPQMRTSAIAGIKLEKIEELPGKKHLSSKHPETTIRGEEQTSKRLRISKEE